MKRLHILLLVASLPLVQSTNVLGMNLLGLGKEKDPTKRDFALVLSNPDAAAVTAHFQDEFGIHPAAFTTYEVERQVTRTVADDGVGSGSGTTTPPAASESSTDGVGGDSGGSAVASAISTGDGGSAVASAASGTRTITETIVKRVGLNPDSACLLTDKAAAMNALARLAGMKHQAELACRTDGEALASSARSAAWMRTGKYGLLSLVASTLGSIGLWQGIKNGDIKLIGASSAGVGSGMYAAWLTWKAIPGDKGVKATLQVREENLAAFLEQIAYAQEAVQSRYQQLDGPSRGVAGTSFEVPINFVASDNTAATPLNIPFTLTGQDAAAVALPLQLTAQAPDAATQVPLALTAQGPADATPLNLVLNVQTQDGRTLQVPVTIEFLRALTTPNVEPVRDTVEGDNLDGAAQEEEEQ